MYICNFYIAHYFITEMLHFFGAALSLKWPTLSVIALCYYDRVLTHCILILIPIYIPARVKCFPMTFPLFFFIFRVRLSCKVSLSQTNKLSFFPLSLSCNYPSITAKTTYCTQLCTVIKHYGCPQTGFALCGPLTNSWQQWLPSLPPSCHSVGSINTRAQFSVVGTLILQVIRLMWPW